MWLSLSASSIIPVQPSPSGTTPPIHVRLVLLIVTDVHGQTECIMAERPEADLKTSLSVMLGQSPARAS